MAGGPSLTGVGGKVEGGVVGGGDQAASVGGHRDGTPGEVRPGADPVLAGVGAEHRVAGGSLDKPGAGSGGGDADDIPGLGQGWENQGDGVAGFEIGEVTRVRGGDEIAGGGEDPRDGPGALEGGGADGAGECGGRIEAGDGSGQLGDGDGSGELGGGNGAGDRGGGLGGGGGSGELGGGAVAGVGDGGEGLVRGESFGAVGAVVEPDPEAEAVVVGEKAGGERGHVLAELDGVEALRDGKGQGGIGLAVGGACVGGAGPADGVGGIDQGESEQACAGEGDGIDGDAALEMEGLGYGGARGGWGEGERRREREPGEEPGWKRGWGLGLWAHGSDFRRAKKETAAEVAREGMFPGRGDPAGARDAPGRRWREGRCAARNGAPRGSAGEEVLGVPGAELIPALAHLGDGERGSVAPGLHTMTGEEFRQGGEVFGGPGSGAQVPQAGGAVSRGG
jgi:hypothetical protein